MFRRLLTLAACLVATVSAKDHIQTKLRSGAALPRAANLGGWLLSEYWMCYNSPLYKGVKGEDGIKGEYAVMKLLGNSTGNKQFDEHWSTWITEDDIAEIAAAGLNTVRVSTGFWIINDVDTTDKTEITNTYPRGGLKYLDKLINVWAVKYNLAVMVSLHAHRGSQNGMDHSAPQVMGEKLWATKDENVASSINYAAVIAKRYKNSPAFLGLNLMNEPIYGVDYQVLFKYYKAAYKAIRDDGNDCIIVTSPWLQEQGPPTMSDFMPCPEYYNVWHEYHVYYKWGWDNVALADVFTQASTYSNTHYTPWTGNPIFLGEWSLATADEDKRTDAELKEFAAVQMKQAELAPAGWAFWAWRHDDESKMTSGWSMRQLLKKGLITVPTTTRKRTLNAKCPVTETTYSNSSSGSGSVGSGSSGSGNGSVLLYTPEKVKAGDTTNVTTTPSTSPNTTTSAAGSLPFFRAALVAVASTVVALATL